MTTSPALPRVSTCLWFDGNAEDAVAFYVSLFPNSQVLFEQPYGDWGPGPKGSVAFITFELDGALFQALNGGPAFTLTEASSMFVRCESQAEIDRLWEALIDGGEARQCGWLKDRYGLSWQIVPGTIGDLLMKQDPARSERLMQAVMGMEKLDIAALENAYHAN